MAVAGQDLAQALAGGAAPPERSAQRGRPGCRADSAAGRERDRRDQDQGGDAAQAPGPPVPARRLARRPLAPRLVAPRAPLGTMSPSGQIPPGPADSPASPWRLK